MLKRLYKKRQELLYSPSDILSMYAIKPKIRLYNYKSQHSEIHKELLDEFSYAVQLQKDEAWDYVKKFEKRFACYYNIPYAIGTNSGTTALQLSLTALGIGSGDEVITSVNGYIGAIFAILNTGAKPVFVDVDEKTYNIDTDKIEAAISDKTKAIMPVHLYGQMCNMEKISTIAKAHKLKVIEDAAQAHGASYLDKKPGYYSDAACFSFHTTKNLGGWGNGGIVICKSSKLKDTLETLQDPSRNNTLLIKSKRTPAYLDESQVIFLNVKLNHLKGWVERRREIASIYNKSLKNSLFLPIEEKGAYHTYHDYVIQVKRRELLRSYMLLKGIETAVHFKKPLHLLKVYNTSDSKKMTFPIAEKISKNIVSIPVNQFLTKNEINHVIECLNKFRF